MAKGLVVDVPTYPGKPACLKNALSKALETPVRLSGMKEGPLMGWCITKPLKPNITPFDKNGFVFGVDVDSAVGLLGLEWIVTCAYDLYRVSHRDH